MVAPAADASSAGGTEIDRDRVVELLRIDLDGRLGIGDARVVDRDIQTAERRGGPLRQLHRRVGLREIDCAGKVEAIENYEPAPH